MDSAFGVLREAELPSLEDTAAGYSGMAVAGQVGSSDRGHTAVAAQPDRVVVGEQPPDCSGFDSAAVVGQPDLSGVFHMAVAERPADSPDKVAGSAERHVVVAAERQAVRLEMIVEGQLAGYWRTSVEEQRVAHSEMTVAARPADYSEMTVAEQQAGYWRMSVEEQRVVHSEMTVAEPPVEASYWETIVAVERYARRLLLAVTLFQRMEPG